MLNNSDSDCSDELGIEDEREDFLSSNKTEQDLETLKPISLKTVFCKNTYVFILYKRIYFFKDRIVKLMLKLQN